jgi:hypothetical protein
MTAYNRGMGSDCFCSGVIGGMFPNTCWTLFPCTDSDSNYGRASDLNIPMPQQWYDTNTIISRMELEGYDPNAPTGCKSTIVTSPFKVCNWVVYAGGIALLLPLAMVMVGDSGPRRYGR